MNRVLAVLFLMLLPVFSYSDVKIGYIDSGRIFEEYEGMETIRRQFGQEQSEWQETAEEMVRELESLKSELESQRLMLSGEALGKKEEEIRSKQREYEDFIQRIWGPDGQATQKNVELTRPVIDKVNSVLEILAEEEGFTMIFDIAEGGVVYAKEGLDLTGLVLDQLNEEFEPAVQIEETKIAIFEFAENTLAEEGKYGQQVYNLVYTLMDQSPKFESIPKDRISSRLTERGLEREKSVPEESAVDIAQEVGAKVLLIGEVNKTIVDIEVVARLIDVDSGVTLHTETKKAEGETEEAFQTMISDLVAALIRRYGH